MGHRFVLEVRRGAETRRFEHAGTPVGATLVLRIGSGSDADVRLEGLEALHCTITAKGHHLMATPGSATAKVVRGAPLPSDRASRIDSSPLSLGDWLVSVTLVAG